MKQYTPNMFQSIREAFNKNKENSASLFSEIMKLAPGNTYTVRLLPFIKDPEKTFFHYYVHGWTSNATGQYVQAVSPQTFGERDPISEERFRVQRIGTDEEKEKMKNVFRSEKWLVNAYVIEDPTNSENNGTVKIIRYGKQLQKIIMEAIEGEDADEFGERIFDLGPNGVSLKIKVEQQGDYPTYVSSRFTNSKLQLSDEQQQEIYNKTYALEDVFTVKSYDELVKMIDEHIYVRIDKSQSTNDITKQITTAPESISKSLVDEDTDISIENVDEFLKDIEF